MADLWKHALLSHTRRFVGKVPEEAFCRRILVIEDTEEMQEDKQTLRLQIWEALRSAGAARFPGARGRIPNFVGAEAAAKHLESTEEWNKAGTIKCNPDLPQRPIRHAALKAGKTVFMAVPKLAERHPFIMLDPTLIGAKNYWKASSIKGAYSFGRPVSVDEMPFIDLIVTGCVAVSGDGVRLGKGGGYSDLEYGLLKHFNKINHETPVATSVHEIQLLSHQAIPRQVHDVTVNLVATAKRLHRPTSNRTQPDGIFWDQLPPEKREAIPVLKAWHERSHTEV